MGRVAGKVALITGAAAGIGRATALLLAREGARLVITDIDDAGVARVADLVQERGGTALALRQDASSESGWKQAIAATLAAHGQLDVLVNNAGVGDSKPLLETSLEDWHSVLRVNLDGVFLGCRYGIEAMRSTETRKRTRFGSVINLSSILGMVGFPEAAAYSASKGGVRLMTKSLALECAARGWDIRVNSVHPGFIWTPMNQETVARLDRMGEADEVAATILFLASDESSFVTGAELVVDGGYTAR
jgi:NAD(P)-dependent dehydrogenase (short-subunit alcohol dehydrogenase family)